MRFREFKVSLTESENNIVVIGDSIAVGINSGQTVPGRAVGGSSPEQVLGFVRTFVQSGKAKGTTVILSSGASNGTFERPNGQKQSLNMGPIEQQLKLLKDAGATVALVGTGSAKSKTFTNKFGSYFVNFEAENVNKKLAAAATSYGAKFLGPLEDFDPGLNTGNGDGIHPYGGYTKLYQAGSSVKSKIDPTSGQGAKPAANSPSGSQQSILTTLSVPNSRIGPAVADIQRVLVALGYSLPRHGVDGVRGRETSAAVSAFQKDNNLKVDGAPGIETVTKLNDMLKSNPKVAGKLTKSTEADVKASMHGTEKLEPAAYNSVTKGKIGKLLDLIARPESGGHYDIMMGGRRNPKILDMTLSELLQYQREYKAAGAETAAAGRYQFMPGTLRSVASSLGLNFNSDTFNPKTQDDLAIHLLRQKGLDSWLNGKMSDDVFMDRLAQVWAGLPSPSKGGASWYQGVGSNKAGISIASVQDTLNDIKTA